MGENKKKFFRTYKSTFLIGTVCGLAIGLTIVLATVLFVFPEKVTAQLNVGQFGSTFGLGTADLLSTVIKIVQYVLGFLGLIAVIMIIYGGIIWMTAAGNAEKVKKAKKIITQAVIGLIIVLLAWAIVTFVFKIINEATNGGPGFTCEPAGECYACNLRCNAGGDGLDLDLTCSTLCPPGGADTFRILWQDPYPGEENVLLCQIIQMKFNGRINRNTIPNNARLTIFGGNSAGDSCIENKECKSGVCQAGNCLGDEVPGTWQIGGIDLAPATCNNGVKDGDETAVDCGGSCPSCEILEFIPDNNYIADISSYHVKIVGDPPGGLQELASPRRMTQGEEWNFDTGTETLATPPTVAIYLGDGEKCRVNNDCASGVCNLTATPPVCVGTRAELEHRPRILPKDGATEADKICLNTPIQAIFSAKMRAATIRTRGSDPTVLLYNNGTGERVFLEPESVVPFPTPGFSTRPENTLSPATNYRVELLAGEPTGSPTKPFFDGIQDVCRNSLDGNYSSTEQGSPGDDDYMDQDDQLPGAPPDPEDTAHPWDFTTDTDTTNVNCYPQITGISPAGGKYELAPGAITINGSNFGILVQDAVFNNEIRTLKERCFDVTSYPNVFPCLASWTESQITTAIPSGPVNNGYVIPSSGSMDGGVFVDIGPNPEDESNRVNFDVTNPQISVLSARSYGLYTGGGAGQYVTIFNRGSDGFGDTAGRVYFRSKSDETVWVEALYPPQPPCDAFWHNNYIVVMVPDLSKPPPVGLGIAASYNPTDGLDPGQPYVVSVQVEDARMPSQRSNLIDFVFSNEPPTPGLCGVNPSCGVQDNPVTFQGTGFGDSQGSGGAYLRIPPTGLGTPLKISSWSNDQVDTTLPDLNTSNQYLGRVYHDSGEKSNELPFRVPCGGIPYVLMNSSCSLGNLNPDDDIYPSPNPWPNSQANCLNFAAHARFHNGSGGFIDMAETTINSTNIKLYTCDGVANCCPSGATTEVPGTIVTPGLYVGLEGFMLEPPADFSPSTWYKIVISKNVESEGGAKLENDFSWCFRTKDNDTPCQVEKMIIGSDDEDNDGFFNNIPPAPNSSANLDAQPATNNCILLQASDYQYNWTESSSEAVIKYNPAADNLPNQRIEAVDDGQSRVTAEEQDSGVEGYYDVRVGLDSCAYGCPDPDNCPKCLEPAQGGCPGSKCDIAVDRCTPSITGLSPSTGPTGATISVNGCWFDYYTEGISKVRFGTKEVTEYPCGRYWTPNQIIVKNPLVNPPDPTGNYFVYVTSAPFGLTNSDGNNQYNFISECCDKFTCNGGAHAGKECYFNDYCGTGFQCTCAHTTAVPVQSTGRCRGGTNNGEYCDVVTDCPDHGAGTSCTFEAGMPGICPPLVPSAAPVGGIVDIGPPGADISKKSYSLWPTDTSDASTYVRYYFSNETDDTKDTYNKITSAERGGHWNQTEIVKSSVPDLAISGPVKVYVDSCPSNSINFQVRCVDDNECATKCCFDTDGDTLKECVDSIYCEEGNPGDQCIYPPVSPVCDAGAPVCQFGLQCIPDNPAGASECRCCCNTTDPNSCPTGLSCLEHNPCVNGNRGLCCGCVTDNVCGDPNNLSCGADTCCHDRPKITSWGPKDDWCDVAAGHCAVNTAISCNDDADCWPCLNVGIKVEFDKNLDNSSLNNDNVIVYSQESSVSEGGSGYKSCIPASCSPPGVPAPVTANTNVDITYTFSLEEGDYLFYIQSVNNGNNLAPYGIYHNFDILLDGNPSPVGNIKNIATRLWDGGVQFGLTTIGHLTAGDHEITVRWNNDWSDGLLDSNIRIYQVGVIKGKIYKGHFSPIDKGFIFYANDVFKAETPYFVLVRGGSKGDPANVGVVFNNLGIRSREGAYLWDLPVLAPDQSRINKLWTFTSGTDVCKLGNIKIAHIKDTGDIATDNVPNLNREDIFDCAGANDCADDIIQDTPPTVWINDLGGNPNPDGNQHVLIAYPYDQYDNPISGVFTWTWTDSNVPKDVVGIEGAVINWNTPPTENPNDTTKAITSKPENGWEAITVKAEDTDGVSPDYGKATGDKIIKVNTCLNPWPDFRNPLVTHSTYSDDERPGYHQPNNTITPYNNFEISYCRDLGDKVLPALAYNEDMAIVKPVVVGGAFTYGNGKDEIIKDFLLIYPDACDKSEYTNKTDCENNGGKWGPIPKDAIGIRVVENEDNLSPEKWYRKLVGSAGPEPSSMTVNGYPAIKAGRTVYVAATNLNNLPICAPEECNGRPGNCCKGSRLYSYIYLISYTDKSTNETIEIYNRLLNNWYFNTNVSDYQDVEYIQRDLKRLLNLEDVWFAMLDYQQKNKTFPKLEAGSYLKQMSTSAWPSWDETLGAALGQDIPKDPLNNITCSDAEAEQATCWNNNKKVFHCDAGPPSHIFAYQVSTDGNTSNLYANLEYESSKPGNWINYYDDPCTPDYAGSNCQCFNYSYNTYGTAFDHNSPQVIINTPANNATVSSGTPQPIVQVTVDDPPPGAGGSKIDKVEYYIDNILQFTEDVDADPVNSSWSWDTTKFNNRVAPDPPYILKVIGYDIYGNFGTAVRQVYVNNSGDHVAPSIFITAPLDNSAISGLALFRARASDNAGINSMDLYIDGVPFQHCDVNCASCNVPCVGPECRSFTCENNINTTNYKNGKHTLKAEATDTSGNIGRKEITVEVSNSDIKKPFVDFDHSNTFLMGSCRRSGAPAHCSDKVKNFDETGVDCGGADCPSCGACSRGETTTDVDYYIGETNCGSADYCSAGNITGTTTVLAVASDDVGVKAVDFYLDGVFMASDPAAPYEWVFESVLVANGNHVLKARASDQVGHWADATITVNVNNVITTNLLIAFSTPPTPAEETPPVKVSSPPSVQIQVMEVDKDGNEVTGGNRIGQKAKYILDGKPIIEIGGQSRWDWLWDTKTTWDGIHEVSSRAFDLNNVGSNTIKRSFEVHNCLVDTSLPVVNITEPTDGATVSSTFTITAIALDAECQGVKNCEAKKDNISLGTQSCTVPPFADCHVFPAKWLNVSACDLSGPNHSVKVTCYDNKDNSSSDQVTVHCQAQCSVPSDCPAASNSCSLVECKHGGTGDCCNYCEDTTKCDGSTCAIGSADWCTNCGSCGDSICNCGEKNTTCSDCPACDLGGPGDCDAPVENCSNCTDCACVAGTGCCGIECKACNLVADGCCPPGAGCTSATDPDCPICNGINGCEKPLGESCANCPAECPCPIGASCIPTCLSADGNGCKIPECKADTDCPDPQPLNKCVEGACVDKGNSCLAHCGQFNVVCGFPAQCCPQGTDHNGDCRSNPAVCCNNSHCSNGVQDCDETGLNCGGADCPACAGTHKECGLGTGTCDDKPGAGANLCSGNPDCKYNKCNGINCDIDIGMSPGPGIAPDECAVPADCVAPTHKECGAGTGTCIDVAGGGADLCTGDADCKYDKCNGMICTLNSNVPGPNPEPDQCGAGIGDCRHKECQGGLCVDVAGEAANLCAFDTDCAAVCNNDGDCLDAGENCQACPFPATNDCPCAAGTTCCDPGGGYQCLDRDTNQACCPAPYHWDPDAPTVNKCCGDDGMIGDNWCSNDDHGRCMSAHWFDEHCTDGNKDCGEDGTDCGAACGGVNCCGNGTCDLPSETCNTCGALPGQDCYCPEYTGNPSSKCTLCSDGKYKCKICKAASDGCCPPTCTYPADPDCPHHKACNPGVGTCIDVAGPGAPLCSGDPDCKYNKCNAGVCDIDGGNAPGTDPVANECTVDCDCDTTAPSQLVWYDPPVDCPTDCSDLSCAVEGDAFIDVAATDSCGIDRIEFYLNGILQSTKTCVAADCTTVAASWDLPLLSDGGYTLTARAYDKKGNNRSMDRTICVHNIVSGPINVFIKAMDRPDPNGNLQVYAGKDNIISNIVNVTVHAEDPVDVTDISLYDNCMGAGLLGSCNPAIDECNINWNTQINSAGDLIPNNQICLYIIAWNASSGTSSITDLKYFELFNFGTQTVPGGPIEPLYYSNTDITEIYDLQAVTNAVDCPGNFLYVVGKKGVPPNEEGVQMWYDNSDSWFIHNADNVNYISSIVEFDFLGRDDAVFYGGGEISSHKGYVWLHWQCSGSPALMCEINDAGRTGEVTSMIIHDDGSGGGNKIYIGTSNTNQANIFEFNYTGDSSIDCDTFLRPAGDDKIHALASYNGKLYASIETDVVPGSGVYKWNGGINWDKVNENGDPGTINCKDTPVIKRLATSLRVWKGFLYAGIMPQSTANTQYLCRFDGTTWQFLGETHPKNPGAPISALTGFDPDGAGAYPERLYLLVNTDWTPMYAWDGDLWTETGNTYWFYPKALNYRPMWDLDNKRIYDLEVFNGQLYWGGVDISLGQAEVWETQH